MIATRICRIVPGVLVLLAGTSLAPAQENREQQETRREQPAKTEAAEKFDTATVLSKIHQTNQREIELGQLAMEKAESRDVRAFGELLVRDHRNADRKLRRLVEDKGIELVEPRPQTVEEKKQDQQKQQAKQRLQKLEGTEFDEVYLTTMEREHTASIRMLTRAHKTLEDRDVRDFVGAKIPILKQHLALALRLQGKDADLQHTIFEEEPEREELRDEQAQEKDRSDE